MKLSKYFIGVILFFLFSIVTYSQQKTKQSTLVMNDPKVGKILIDIRNKLVSYKSYKLVFNFENIEVKEKSSEKMVCSYISKEPKFKLSMPDREVYCDGKSIWTYSSVNKEVQINTYKNQHKVESPLNLVKNFEKEYYYHFKEEEAPKKNQKIIELTPIDKKKAIFKIDLIVDIVKNRIVYSKIYEKSGVRQIFSVVEFQENVAFNDADFVFNEANYPKDIEIVDLR